MFDEKEIEKYSVFLSSKSCTAGRGSIAFSRDGSVRSCTQERKEYGNILIEPLEVIVERFDPWLRNENVPDKCRPCDYYTDCHGGCRVAAKSINGELNSFEPYSRGPIKNRKRLVEDKINFDGLQVTKQEVRYREEESDSFVIYLNPFAYAIVNQKGLDVFRRYLAGKTFFDIVKETNDEEGIKEFSTFLFRSGLLKNDI